MKVVFFDNGNTMFFDDKGQQVPILQESWFLLYVKFLEQQEIDPLKIKFSMPDGYKTASLFKTSEGNYNWRIE